MGELYITDPQILLTANRMSLRRNERALEFLRRVEQEMRKLKNAASKFSQTDNAAKKAPKDMDIIQDVVTKADSGSLSRDMLPFAVKSVVTAQTDLKKRYRHLPDDIKGEVSSAVQKGEEFLKKLVETEPQEKPTEQNHKTQAGPVLADVLIDFTCTTNSSDDITVLQEESIKSSVSERLGFSFREQRIFQLIIDAIAQVSGGKETETFAKYLQKIEEALTTEFPKIRKPDVTST